MPRRKRKPSTSESQGQLVRAESQTPVSSGQYLNASGALGPSVSPDVPVVLQRMPDGSYVARPHDGSLAYGAMTAPPMAGGGMPLAGLAGDPGTGHSHTGFQGQIVMSEQDGVVTQALRGHIEHVERRRVQPSADDTLRQAKRAARLGLRRKLYFAGGSVVALLALMIAGDLLGSPHIRTAPETYLGLEGEKTFTGSAQPLVALLPLERSLFAHAWDILTPAPENHPEILEIQTELPANP